LPVQFHSGFGDADLQLDQADPLLLTPLLRQYGARGTTVVLLHCYPYHRQAGYLSAVFGHVHFDVGLALPYLGAGSRGLLAEALELAPFAKQLFSSDAYGLAELYLVAAALFRRGLRAILDGWLAAGDCTAADADRIYADIAGANARRIYPLADGERPTARTAVATAAGRDGRGPGQRSPPRVSSTCTIPRRRRPRWPRRR
jgi:predicted TIM-barrel fold metal-dependent hydrolase